MNEIPKIFWDELKKKKDKYEWTLVNSKSYNGTITFKKIRGYDSITSFYYCPMETVYGKDFYGVYEPNFSYRGFGPTIVACADDFRHHEQFSEEIRNQLLERVGLK